MTPAPTIFSSTASSYDYEFDGDEEVYDSARLFTGEEDDNGAKGMGRKRGLLEKLKRWTGAYSYPVERSVGDEDGVVRGRGRTPELEAGVLYSESPSHSLQHSDSYKSITHEQETSSSLARNNTTNTTTTSTKTSSVISTRSSRRYPNLRRSQTRGYGHGRADSDVTIQLPPPSFSLPTNDADRNQDMYTALPSRVSRSRSRSASPVKRTLPTLPIAAPSQPVVPTEETSTIPRLVGGRPHPGPLPRVDSTILPLSPPLLSSPPLEQSLMFTSMLSLGGGQDTGANTGMGGMRRGVALVDPPIRHGFGLRLQDVGPMMDSPSSPGEAESEKRVAVSQGFDDSEARSNAGRVIGNKGTGTGTGKNVNGPRILKSTRRRGGGGATSMSMRDQTIPTPPAAPQPAPSVSMPTPRAVGRVLTRNSERSGGWIW
ncbi:hypothetical protein BD410DRAFT_790124 [Rickenella mellea]|uniref:Uncharacterized protein n=1 Tax=Rickenella mellea TaxID=50990 RepID=A0A4Y7Q2Q9_9AGAM|nr:hypothetical protein BD410DRAFT_790124 [Rickenella mellea]